MSAPSKSIGRSWLLWAVLGMAVIVPLYFAATSQLLAWRQPVYIAAGLAGVFALILLLIQPLLAQGLLTGFSLATSRRLHRWVGGSLLIAVLIHVGALWITSPPDVVDALLLRSPTPFSLWGVIAMWAMFATALLAIFRKRMALRWRSWRIGHSLLAVLIVGGTVLHAMLIDGTMETISKTALCGLVLLASLRVLADPASLERMRKARR